MNLISCLYFFSFYLSCLYLRLLFLLYLKWDGNLCACVVLFGMPATAIWLWKYEMRAEQGDTAMEDQERQDWEGGVWAHYWWVCVKRRKGTGDQNNVEGMEVNGGGNCYTNRESNNRSWTWEHWGGWKEILDGEQIKAQKGEEGNGEMNRKLRRYKTCEVASRGGSMKGGRFQSMEVKIMYISCSGLSNTKLPGSALGNEANVCSG